MLADRLHGGCITGLRAGQHHGDIAVAAVVVAVVVCKPHLLHLVLLSTHTVHLLVVAQHPDYEIGPFSF